MQLMFRVLANSLQRIGLVACAAMISSGPVVAQIANSTPPAVITPLSTEPDQNNVNITNGRIRIGIPSMGVPAAPRLTLDTVQSAMPYLVAKIGSGQGDYVESSVSVHIGGATSISFSCQFDDVCSDRKANGAVLDGAIAMGGPYSVTVAPSGAVYQFDRLSYDSGVYAPRQVIYYASSVTYPDGEHITYTYETANYPSGQGATQFRVTQIASNIGYHMTFSYQGNDVNFPAWKTVAVQSIYKSSNPATPLQRLTYSGTTITDLAGDTYACSGCDYRVGGQIEISSAAVTLPTESSPAQTVSSTSFNASVAAMVTSVARDGVGWSYSYANWRLLQSPEGYGYDSVVVTGPNGFNHTYNITAGSTARSNRISSIVDSIGRTTSFSFDGNDRLTQITYPEGNAVQTGYDTWGNVTSKVSQPKPGSGLNAISETATIDATGCAATQVLCYRIASHTDALGRITNYTYDGSGRLTQRMDPPDSSGVRRVTYLTYGSSLTAPTIVRTCGFGTTCGTSAEVRTEYTYLGVTALPLTETRIDAVAGTSLTTSYVYDDAGRLLSSDGPYPGSDDAVYFRYDVLGRKTWEIGAKGPNNLHIAKRITYRDSDNKVTAVEFGTLTSSTDTNFVVFERTDTTFDSKRNPIREVRKSGTTTYAVTDRSFLDRGLPECTAVRMNLAALPAAGSACALGTEGTQGKDRVTKNVYDNAGQLVQVREGVGVTGVEAAEATYSYTNNGKRNYVIDANGNRAQLTYDGFDRQLKWIFPSTTRPGSYNDATQSTALSTAGAINSADYEQYGYDVAGNRTSLRKRDGSTLAYTYDNLNRMIVKVVPSRSGLTTAQVRDVYYEYDLRGAMTKARFDSLAGADGVTNSYNGFGELSSSTINMGGFSKTLSYTYDLAGKRIELNHPDNQKFTYARDVLGRVSNIYEGTTQTSTWQLIQNSFDNRGLIDWMQRATSGLAFKADFTFDPIGRLSSLANDATGTANDLTISQIFNPASQIASQTRSNDAYAWTGSAVVDRDYTTNGLNQYTVAGPASFAYDANGNITSDGSTTFVYDIENRLVSASGAKTASLVYDPMGRLWQVTGPTTNTRFHYDGDELVAEYDSGGTMARRYVHADNVDEPVVQYDGASVGASYRRFLMPDERGSIVGLIDSAGASLAMNSYDEYGIPSASNQGRFQYTGQAWLPELGMYHYKARIYSPTLGRFLQTDPIGYDDQINLYAYVGNDPVNGTDPTGMACTGSLISNENGTCPGAGNVNPGLNGAGTSDGAVPGEAQNGQEKDTKDASTENPLAGSLNPLAVAYGELTADYESGRITAEEFQETDKQQGTATATVAVGPTVRAGTFAARVVTRNVVFQGAGKGAKYGVGRIGQVRIGGGRLILRLDRPPRTGGVYHVNIESHSFGINWHIPVNPIHWFGF